MKKYLIFLSIIGLILPKEVFADNRNSVDHVVRRMSIDDIARKNAGRTGETTCHPLDSGLVSSAQGELTYLSRDSRQQGRTYYNSHRQQSSPHQTHIAEDELQHGIFQVFHLGQDDYLLKNQIRSTLQANLHARRWIRELVGHVIHVFGYPSDEELHLERLVVEAISRLGQNGQLHPFIRDTIHRWKRIRANPREVSYRISVLEKSQELVVHNQYDSKDAMDTILADYGYQQDGYIFHIRHYPPR